MTTNDYLAPLAAKLTLNGAINLRNSVANPSEDPDSPFGAGGIFTGSGKWTTLAAIGVERHLCSIGAAEMKWTGTWWHSSHQEHQKNMICRITPLGRELAAYITTHWDDLTFRETKWK